MAQMNRIVNLFRRGKVEREIEDELAAHIAMRTDDNRAAGMSAREARRNALVHFGNAFVMQERTAEADVSLWLETVWSDLRYTLRQLRNAPGFSVTSILILAVGIGACTAIFSVIKPILLDPLPYPKPSQLVMVREVGSGGGPRSPNFAIFHGLVQRSQSFAAMAAMKAWQPAILTAPGQTGRPERLDGQRVSSAYFATLGISPRLGRGFQPEDDRIHGPKVAILSDRLWQRRFAADRHIIGAQVPLDGDLYTVIGVMPAAFENVFEPSAEIWAPLQYDPALPPDGREWGHHLHVMARLRSGVTPEQAGAESAAIVRTLAGAYAKGYSNSGGAPGGIFVNPLKSDLISYVRPALLAVSGAVALVLLIACVNVTNLLLARSVQRAAEFAMRAALGASHGRLVRQLLTESLLLALLGGGLGLLIAEAGVHALVAFSPPELSRVGAITVNAPVFLFSLAVTALIGTGIGLVPSLQASHADLHTGLRQGSHQTTGRHTMRSLLVAAEVSIAVILLVAAGLLLRTMQHLFAADPGFAANHLLTMQVQETGHRYDSDDARLHFFQQALERVRALPGVVSAGFSSQLPLSGEQDVYGVEFEGITDANGEPAFRYAVAPGYLETMRIPLLRGRAIDEHDTAGAPAAVLTSDSLARRILGSQNPIGHRVRVGPDAGHSDRPWATIVGVVGSVTQESLAIGAQDAIYISSAQWNWVDETQSLVVRTKGDPAALAATVRDAVWSVDKDLPIVRAATMDRLLAASEAQRHFVLMLFEAFALTGLALAATGLYGVLAGSVTERTREIGVRAALGASRGNIVALVLRQGMALTALGVVIGLGGAVAASSAIATLLFGVSQLDPVTYLAVIVLLLCVSGIACFLPARRAASINPVEAMRAE